MHKLFSIFRGHTQFFKANVFSEGGTQKTQNALFAVCGGKRTYTDIDGYTFKGVVKTTVKRYSLFRNIHIGQDFQTGDKASVCCRSYAHVLNQITVHSHTDDYDIFERLDMYVARLSYVGLLYQSVQQFYDGRAVNTRVDFACSGLFLFFLVGFSVNTFSNFLSAYVRVILFNSVLDCLFSCQSIANFLTARSFDIKFDFHILRITNCNNQLVSFNFNRYTVVLSCNFFGDKTDDVGIVNENVAFNKGQPHTVCQRA